MSKEYWEQCYEAACEDIALEENIEWEEAESLLLYRLDKDPGFLNCYLSYE